VRSPTFGVPLTSASIIIDGKVVVPAENGFHALEIGS